MYNLGSAKTMAIILSVFCSNNFSSHIDCPTSVYTYVLTYKGKVIGKHLSGSSTEDKPVS